MSSTRNSATDRSRLRLVPIKPIMQTQYFRFLAWIRLSLSVELRHVIAAGSHICDTPWEKVTIGNILDLTLSCIKVGFFVLCLHMLAWGWIVIILWIIYYFLFASAGILSGVTITHVGGTNLRSKPASSKHDRKAGKGLKILKSSDPFEREKLVSLKNAKAFLSFVGNLSWRVVRISTLCSTSDALSRVRMIHNFSQYLLSQEKSKGISYVISYLKFSQLALSKYLALQPVKSLRELNSDFIYPRLAKGLPKWIKPRDRDAIRRNQRGVIILWMSIFGIFRVIAGLWNLKIGSITRPYSGSQNLDTMAETMKTMSFMLLRGRLGTKDHSMIKLSPIRLLPVQTSSPSASFSLFGALIDLFSLQVKHPKLFSSLKDYWSKTNSQFSTWIVYLHTQFLNNRSIRTIILKKRLEAELLNRSILISNFSKISDCSKKLSDCIESISQTEASLSNIVSDDPITADEFDELGFLYKNPDSVGEVGQLAFKKEPAGKLRNFAMVDVWTQSTLKPLHDALSRILKGLPNDGTFNQELSYKRAIQKSKEYNCSFGFDLSEATDRLPIVLQKAVVDSVFRHYGYSPEESKNLSQLWGSILVERDYRVPKPPKGVSVPDDTPLSVRYSVGQPMGALSSFNMLALIHHMIIQLCAIQIGLSNGRDWYEKYEVTGDDVVIFDSLLAERYLRFMAVIGMEINEKKSVISTTKPAGEYLKKTWVHQSDVSQISWKQLFSSSSSILARIGDSLYFIRKWSTTNIPVHKILWATFPNFHQSRMTDQKLFNIPYIAIVSNFVRQSGEGIQRMLPYLYASGEVSQNLLKFIDTTRKWIAETKLLEGLSKLERKEYSERKLWTEAGEGTSSFKKSFQLAPLYDHTSEVQALSISIDKRLLVKLAAIQYQIFGTLFLDVLIDVNNFYSVHTVDIREELRPLVLARNMLPRDTVLTKEQLTKMIVDLGLKTDSWIRAKRSKEWMPGSEQAALKASRIFSSASDPNVSSLLGRFSGWELLDSDQKHSWFAVINSALSFWHKQDLQDSLTRVLGTKSNSLHLSWNDMLRLSIDQKIQAIESFESFYSFTQLHKVEKGEHRKKITSVLRIFKDLRPWTDKIEKRTPECVLSALKARGLK